MSASVTRNYNNFYTTAILFFSVTQFSQKLIEILKLEATDWKNGKVEIILQMFTRKQDLTCIWFLRNTLLIPVSSVIILRFLKKCEI